MTENQMCPAVSGIGLPCALLEDHARPSPDYPHITIEGHQFQQPVKPAVEEPMEFGSIVRAGVDGISDRVLWCRGGGRYWFNETSRRSDFSDFHHPEVLRVGIGEPQPRPVEELVGVLTDPNWGQANAYERGRTDFAEATRRDLSALRAEALSAERKDAYDKALATVAALLGES